MANSDTPMGFRPVRHRSGAPYTGAANPYWIKVTQNNDVFIGDLVVTQGTSNDAVVKVPGAGTFPPGTLPEILVATKGAGNPTVGAIVAFAADPTALENQYRLDSTERVAFVCDDPDVVFEVQCDSANAPAITNVGASFNIETTHGGSTTTGLSGMELEVSEESSSDPQGQLILTRFVNREDNDAEAIHAKAEVILSTHQYSSEGPVANDGLQPV